MINRLPKQFSGVASTTAAPASRISGLPSEEQQRFTSRIVGAAADCVGSRPLLSLGFVFGLGILLGKLVKR
jgi:hypothetical protein